MLVGDLGKALIIRIRITFLIWTIAGLKIASSATGEKIFANNDCDRCVGTPSERCCAHFKPNSARIARNGA